MELLPVWSPLTFYFAPGTEFWGVFNPEWSMCHNGRRQSPINVEPESLLFDPHLRYVHIDKATVGTD